MSGKFLLDTNITIALFTEDASVQKNLVEADRQSRFTCLCRGVIIFPTIKKVVTSMAEPLEKYFKNKRFSLREIKEAQKKLDLKPRCGDEEYAEVVLKEYAELLPYRERANKCRQ